MKLRPPIRLQRRAYRHGILAIKTLTDWRRERKAVGPLLAARTKEIAR